MKSQAKIEALQQQLSKCQSLLADVTEENSRISIEDKEKIKKCLTQCQELTDSVGALKAELKESKKMFQLVMDSIPVRVFWKDRESVYLGCNMRFAEDAGVATPENIRGKTDYDLPWKKEEADFFVDIDRRVMSLNEEELGFIEPQLHADGKNSWLETNKVPIVNDEEKVIGVLGTYQDITLRVESQIALKNNERKWKSYIDNAPEGIIISDKEGKLIEVNNAACKYVGLRQGELLEKKMKDLIAYESLNAFEKHNTKLLKKGSASTELHYNRVGNEIGDWLIDSVKIDRELILNFARDITARKNSERTLSKSEEKYRVTLQSIGDAVISTDVNGRIVQMNQVAEELTAWKLIEARGKPLSKVFKISNGITGKPTPDPVKKVVERGEKVTLEEHTRLISRNNNIYQISDSGAPIKNENNEVTGVVLVFRDVTKDYHQRRQLEFTQFTLEQANTAVFWVYATGQFLYVNGTAREWLQYSLGEFLNMSICDINPEFPAELWQEHWNDIRKNKMVRMESVHQRKNGEIYPVEIFSHHIEYEGEEYKLAFVYDITEKKKAEAKQERSDRRFSLLYKTMTQGVVFLNNRFEILDCNSAATKILEAPKNELICKNFLDYNWQFRNERLEIVTKEKNPVFKSLKSGKGIKDFRIAMQNVETGAMKWLTINVIAESNSKENGEAGLYVIFDDITARTIAEHELMRIKNFMVNIIDSMPSVLIAVDKKLNITQWNIRARNEYKMMDVEVEGQPLAEVIPQFREYISIIKQAIEQQRVRIENRRMHRQGKRNVFEDITIYPLTGGLQGAVIRVDDITEKIRLEEMMIQSEKMLSIGGLAAGMAHEINNPLAGILQNTEVLKRRLTDKKLPANTKAAKELGIDFEKFALYFDKRGLNTMLSDIHKSGKRAALIVKNMLSFARKSDKAYSTNSMQEILEETVALANTDYDLKKNYDFRQINILYQFDKDLPQVLCEKSKIQQVFLNVLKNGAEEMGSNGTYNNARPEFKISVYKENEYLVTVIEDNGKGMDEHVRKRVFEPFFTTKSVGKGTGLGLSVSYFIITENHSGKMSVESEKNKGTRFIISLPLYED